MCVCVCVTNYKYMRYSHRLDIIRYYTFDCKWYSKTSLLACFIPC